MNIKKITAAVIIVVLITSIFALPIGVSAKTIQQFENEVRTYTKELEDKKIK